MISTLFNVLEFTSIIGTAYLSYYEVAPRLQLYLEYPVFKPYKDRLRPENLLNETNFCKLVASLSGAYVGRLVWPIALPFSLLYLEHKHGTILKNWGKSTPEPSKWSKFKNIFGRGS